MNDNLFDLEDFGNENPELITKEENIIEVEKDKKTKIFEKQESKQEEPQEEEKENKIPIKEENKSNSNLESSNSESSNSESSDSESLNSKSSEKILPKQEDLLIEKQPFLNSSEIHAIEDEIELDLFDKISPKAILYPFPLDDFQKRSIIRLERHENVLVCAHTSSGKTVVAEYGIALGKKNNKRVFYTSPIKALSNQKYRDFKEKFSDVGILTGDVSINPDAQCLIMTTEILQNSLYKNSELLNSVDWVIFDEVHYINDNERGHVWEEILILLPQGIGIIMLSATIPNYMEFAEWVGKIKKTTVYVQNTLKRIVPLEHNIFIDKKNVFLVKNKENNVYEDNVRNALKKLDYVNDKHKKDMNFNKKYYNEIKERESIYMENIEWYEQFHKKNKSNKYTKNNNYYNKRNQKNHNDIRITKMHLKIEDIIDYLYEKELTPSVIFVFSIKKINEYGKMLSTKNLITKNESNKIRKFYDECINTLSEEDKAIPQIQELREILITGIGIHHSGLLPILKEIIEILYSKGYIKILFATTSFSIGLNMPAKTVVFTDIYKYNDENLEILSSSEYLQMCGRAGRRGIDTIGYVFLMYVDNKNKNKNESEEIINMLKGSGTEVESKFRLSYRTVISFFSRNIKEIDEFFQQSFLESKTLKDIPKVMAELELLKIKSDKIKKIDCGEIKDNSYIEEYFTLEQKLSDINNKIFRDKNIIMLLNTEENDKKQKGKGRILKVFDKEKLIEIYVCEISYYTQYNNEIWCIKSEGKAKKKIIYEDKQSNSIFSKNGYCKGIKYSYKTYYISDIREIYNYQIQNIYKNYKFPEDKEGYRFLPIKDLSIVLRTLNDLYYNSKDLKIYPIDYLNEGKNDFDLGKLIEERKEILNKIKANKCNECSLKNNHYKQYNSYLEIEKEIKEKEKNLDPKNMEHYNEFNTRLKILKKLNYIDENNIITLKGKAAREIGTTDCLLISELLVSNILNKLPKSEIIAFVSGFCSNKNEIIFDINQKISFEFNDVVFQFKQIYDDIIKIENDYNFKDNKYDRRITFSISKAMKSWMEGRSFSYILEETELEEGKLYNLIMRIFMFLEEVINFYGSLGNKNLYEKYEEIKKELMRGIMSKQSLYLQDSINLNI